MFEIKPIFNALLRSKLGAVLLMTQIVITMAIVSNAGFIIKDRMQYLNQDSGYPEDQVFHFSVYYFEDTDNLVQNVQETENTIRNMPQVRYASAILEVPLTGSGSGSTFGNVPIEQEDSEQAVYSHAAYTSGDQTILDSLGLEIAQGRNFLPSEIFYTTDSSKFPSVAIITQAYADALYPDGTALGEPLYIGSNPVQIIGIVDAAKGPWLKSETSDHLVIFPNGLISLFQKFVVRTDSQDRDSVMANIEKTLLEANENIVVSGIRGLDESKKRYNSGDILMMRMLIILVVVLMLVTALGIFGMTVFSISKRTKQIGTRRAIGAKKSNIIRYFLVENTMICLGGLILGSAAAILLGHQLMTHYDLPKLPFYFVAITAVFVYVSSLISVYFPANKAANISPSIATKTI